MKLGDLLGRPFKAKPKKENYQSGQFEYVKMSKSKKMNMKMCQIFKQLNKQAWEFNENKYSYQQYKSVIQLIQQCQSVSISIEDSNPAMLGLLINLQQNPMNKENKMSREYIANKENILKKQNLIHRSVNSPVFSNLIQLLVTNCDLNNIQAIQYINAPNLSILMLKENNITHLQAIKKFYFPQLQFLSLCFNYIKSVDQLQSMSRFVTKNKQRLTNLKDYVYNTNQQYYLFEFQQYNIQYNQQTQQPNPIPQIICSPNSFYQNNKLKQLMNRRLQQDNQEDVLNARQFFVKKRSIRQINQIPFLAKSVLFNQPKFRPKISY